MRAQVPPPVPLALSPAEAAAALGVSRAFIYRLLANGTLPSVRLGRCRRIRRSDVEGLLDTAARDDR